MSSKPVHLVGRADVTPSRKAVDAVPTRSGHPDAPTPLAVKERIEARAKERLAHFLDYGSIGDTHVLTNQRMLIILWCEYVRKGVRQVTLTYSHDRANVWTVEREVTP